MVYITSPGLTHFISLSLYLLTTFTHFTKPYPRPLATTYLFSVFMSSVFFVFCFLEISHISEIIHYLSSSVQFISLSIMPSRSIHTVPNVKKKKKRFCFYFCIFCFPHASLVFLKYLHKFM